MRFGKESVFYNDSSAEIPKKRSIYIQLRLRLPSLESNDKMAQYPWQSKTFSTTVTTVPDLPRTSDTLCVYSSRVSCLCLLLLRESWFEGEIIQSLYSVSQVTEKKEGKKFHRTSGINSWYSHIRWPQSHRKAGG